MGLGNRGAHKPSELSSLSIRVLCEIYAEAGMPEGVYNMVLGYGQEAGVPLVVASQFPLTIEGSVTLTRALYSDLFWGRAVRRAA